MTNALDKRMDIPLSRACWLRVARLSLVAFLGLGRETKAAAHALAVVDGAFDRRVNQ